MTCDHVQPSLKAYLDRELNLRERVALSFHLSRCPLCRAEMEAIRMASHEFKSLDAPESSDETRRAVLEAAHTQRPSPLRTAGRRVRSWGLAFGAAGALLALAAYLTLRPSPAQAALARVAAAVEAVRTQHTVMWMQPPGGPRETRVSWYAEGKWRMETRREGELTELTVYDGEWSNGYNPATNTAYLRISEQPFGTDFKGFSVAAMMPVMRDAKVEVETVNEDGRVLNRFDITREGLPERYVILADPQTDLPISLQLYVRVDGAWKLAGGAEVMEYNVPVDPKLFVLSYPADAEVVDKGSADDRWRQRYQRGLVRVRAGDFEAVLRDFQVTVDGDVFAIWTPGEPAGVPGPEAELRDNLGTVYLREWDSFQAGGDPCAWFIPLKPLASRPKWYELVVQPEGVSVSFRVTDPVFTPQTLPQYPIPKHERGKPAFMWPFTETELRERHTETLESYRREHGESR